MRIFLTVLLSSVILSGCGSIPPSVTADAASKPSSASTALAPIVQQENPTSQPSEAVLVPEPVSPPAPQPLLRDFVRVRDHLPGIFQDLKYATADNFTGQTIYGFSDAYLRYGTLLKLARAQAMLSEENYRLLIWDAFRPVQAQFRLWEVCPDPVYVANPEKGFSSHSRGNTVDVTLVTADGKPVEMPTGFDDFSPLADRDYRDVSPSAAANAQLLEEVMSACGFKPYSGEWWHFSDTDQYPVEEFFLPE